MHMNQSLGIFDGHAVRFIRDRYRVFNST